MKAFREIGLGRALRYALLSPLNIAMQLFPYPQLRSLLLKALGARIGKDSVVENVVFVNFYYRGFGSLRLGDNCFIGPKVIIDLAGEVELGDHSTISMGATILTHMNVGYKDHPLQARYPKRVEGVKLKRGAFVGAGAIIFPGTVLGENCLVGAGSVVKESQPANSVVTGNPGKAKKKILV